MPNQYITDFNGHINFFKFNCTIVDVKANKFDYILYSCIIVTTAVQFNLILNISGTYEQYINFLNYYFPIFQRSVPRLRDDGKIVRARLAA